MTVDKLNNKALYKIIGIGITRDMSVGQKRSLLLNNVLAQSNGLGYFIVALLLWKVFELGLLALLPLFMGFLEVLVLILVVKKKYLLAKILNLYGISILATPLLIAGLNATGHLLIIDVYLLVTLGYCVMAFNWEVAFEKQLSIGGAFLCFVLVIIFPWLDPHITFPHISFALDETILSNIFPILGFLFSFIGYYFLRSFNINAHAELEEAMAEVEKKTALQQAIFNSADAIIISTDAQGTITGFNRKAEELLGYEAKEVIGQFDISIFYDGYEMVSKSEKIAQLVGRRVGLGFDTLIAKTKAGMVNESEWTMVRKDGGQFPAKTVHSAIKNSSGETIGYTKVATDISSEKEAELQIKQQHEELRASEEELRQNLEELQATQEALQKTNAQMEYTLEEVNFQKQLVDKKHTAVIASLNYAKRIQDAMLPTEHRIQKYIPNSFLFYLPREVVSGDFYWMHHTENHLFIATMDCTGHGAPGAFMSLIGNALLQDAVVGRELTDPADILHSMNYGLVKRLQQHENQSKDGMEGAICVIDKEAKTLRFAGAKSPLIYFKEGKFHKIKGDRSSIGMEKKMKEKQFTTHEVSLDTPVRCYLFSDGYQDQFGEVTQRKFMSSRLHELLIGMQSLSFENQAKKVRHEFMEWKGAERQIDDVMLFGFEVE